MTRQRYLVTCAMAFAVAGLPFLFVEEMMASAQDRTSNGNTTGSAVPRSGDGGGSAAASGGGGSSAGSTSSGGGGVRRRRRRERICFAALSGLVLD